MEFNVQEASEDEIEDESEDNKLCSTTSDNDDHSTNIINVTDNMEDNADDGANEEGVDRGELPKIISRIDRSTPQSLLRIGSRTIPDIYYKVSAGVRGA